MILIENVFVLIRNRGGRGRSFELIPVKCRYECKGLTDDRERVVSVAKREK